MRLVRCALLYLLLSSSPGVTAEYPWEEEPASRWTRDFSNSARDNRVPLPTTQLEQERIGEKITVHDLFDRWVLNESVHVRRGKYFTEVTKDCKGKIELELLADFGNQLSGREKEAFMRALLGGCGCLNRISASISGASAGVRPPRGKAAS